MAWPGMAWHGLAWVGMGWDFGGRIIFFWFFGTQTTQRRGGTGNKFLGCDHNVLEGNTLGRGGGGWGGVRKECAQNQHDVALSPGWG